MDFVTYVVLKQLKLIEKLRVVKELKLVQPIYMNPDA